MINRTRRLRKTENIRRLVRENKLTTDDLIFPLFIEEGENIESEIKSMPGFQNKVAVTYHNQQVPSPRLAYVETNVSVADIVLDQDMKMKEPLSNDSE